MEETETLGKYLRRERELKKVSLRELSKNTRVREQILKAIEEDRYDLLPSPTFVKGFLSAYAKYVGLNANDIIQRYQRAVKGTPDSEPSVIPEKKIERTRKHRWYLGAAILGGILGAVLVVLYLFFLEPPAPVVKPPPMKSVEKETPVLPPAPPQIEDTQPPASAPPQIAETNPPAPPPPQVGGTYPPDPSPPKAVGTSPPPASPSPKIGGMTPPQKENPISLQLKAVETTWLSIKVDAEAEREMILRPGESIPLEGASQIYVLIGNAGGLDLIHNGKALEKFGKSGDVVALTFTRQSLDVKRFEKSKPQ